VPALIRAACGAGYSVREFVDACLKVTQANIKVVEQTERRPGDYAEVYSDPSKIKRELGWQAKYVDLEENLGMAWSWRKEHANGY
jgi:UDP-arabinose 4-epimerase